MRLKEGIDFDLLCNDTIPTVLFADPVIRKEAARGTKMVGWDDSGTVRACNGETSRIVTGRMTGCNAVATVVERPGLAEARIQHHYSGQISFAAESLRQYLEDARSFGFETGQAVVVAPGRFGKADDPNISLAFQRELRPFVGENYSLVTYNVNRWSETRLLVELLSAKNSVIRVNDRAVVPGRRNLTQSILKSALGR